MKKVDLVASATIEKEDDIQSLLTQREIVTFKFRALKHTAKFKQSLRDKKHSQQSTFQNAILSLDERQT